jgi:hypothetical protein
MSLVRYRCSSCKEVMEVPADKRGKTIACPHCGMSASLPRAAGAASSDKVASSIKPVRPDLGGRPSAGYGVKREKEASEETEQIRPYIPGVDDEDLAATRKSAKKTKKEKRLWRTVRKGFLLTFAAQCLAAIPTLLMAVGAVIALALPDVPDVLYFGVTLALIVLPLQEVSAASGFFLYLYAPKSEPKGWAVATFPAAALVLIGWGVALILNVSSSTIGVKYATVFLTMIPLFAQGFISLGYIRAVAYAVDERWLSNHINRDTRFFLGSAVGWLLMLGIMLGLDAVLPKPEDIPVPDWDEDDFFGLGRGRLIAAVPAFMPGRLDMGILGVIMLGLLGHALFKYLRFHFEAWVATKDI